MSPMMRARAECNARGWPSSIVEKWIAQAKKRVDMFGIIDLVALDGKPGVLGIQVTSGDNHAAHRQKLMVEKINETTAWLRAGNRLEIWSYSKRGAQGKRKLWTLRVEAISMGSFELEAR